MSLAPTLRTSLETIEKPAFPLLAQQGHPWLLANGSSSATLEQEVAAMTGRQNHRWLWRDTEWEYNAPGYRQGPLLVALNERLFNTFLQWAPEFSGAIILTAFDDDALFTHLHQHRVVLTADGNPVKFHLGMLRQLEEFADALSASRLAQLLGPVQSLIWRSSACYDDNWFRLQNPDPGPPQAELLQLTTAEQADLNQANQAWFMANTTRRLVHEYPQLTQCLDPEELSRRLKIFKQESAGLALVRERDAYHFMRLRLAFGQEHFEHDTSLNSLLCNRAIDARVRLSEAELRLQQLTATT